MLYWGSYIATAQIINIEDKRVRLNDSIHWVGFVDISANYVKNDKAILNFRTSSFVEYKKDRHLVFALVGNNLLKADNSPLLNDAYGHLRYNYELNQWLTGEAFGQLQYNEKIQLRLRQLLGAGLRFRLKPWKNQRFYLGIAPLFENNQYQLQSALNDWRVSSYLSFRLQWRNTLKLNATTYYQFLIKNPSINRLSSEATLLWTLTKRCNFKSTFSISYDQDTRLMLGIPRQLISWTNGIRIDF